jgi:glycosyltransferase involved in cell wall biosynthesis
VTSSLRIIVTGLMAAYPLGGMAWHYLQYVLGLARLGHEVYYLEDSARDPYSPAEGGPSRSCTLNVNYLAGLMARFRLADRWAYRARDQARWLGLADAEREEVLRSADLLLNVSGSLDSPEDYRQVRRLAYVDTDPVFTPLKLARNTRFRARVDAHDVHFSFGERADGPLPATGHRWRGTRQPVLLSEWRTGAPHREVYTTVMSWTSYKSETYSGQTYGHKDIEFLRFLELPRLVAPAALEVALASGRTRQAPRELLAENGWRLADPAVVCPDLDSYRAYIESSKGEWSVAKNAYVQGRSGWFSERSACYLAAGRPVVVQDTSFSATLPVGEGLLPFTTLAEAVAAIHEVEAHYPRHARAARALAEEYFDSDKVLTRLLEEALI